jgi:hypothetical protein
MKGAYGNSDLRYGCAEGCNHPQGKGLAMTKSKLIMAILSLTKSICIIENTVGYTESVRRQKILAIAVGFDVLTVVVMKTELFMTFQGYCIPMTFETHPI